MRQPKKSYSNGNGPNNAMGPAGVGWNIWVMMGILPEPLYR